MKTIKTIKKKVIIMLTICALALSVAIPTYAISVPASGGTHTYGVSGGIWFYQYSYYYHGERAHYATAMMNGVNTKTSKTNAGYTACADSQRVFSCTSRNSYYSF